MNEQSQTSEARQAVTNGLAVTGFIALVLLGIWLAAYATKFIPSVVGSLGSAAVYLGSVFTPGDNTDSLATIPGTIATSTINFGVATSSDTTPVVTAPTPSSPAAPAVPTPARPAAPVRGSGSSAIYPIGTTTAPTRPAPGYYGLADLAVQIAAAGYLTSSSTAAFVASSTVPDGARPAIKFTIKNVGTNIASGWRFSVTLPRSSAYLFQSDLQQALGPGDSIEYTLGFDQPNRGAQTISVVADAMSSVSESNESNNTASTQIVVQ